MKFPYIATFAATRAVAVLLLCTIVPAAGSAGTAGSPAPAAAVAPVAGASAAAAPNAPAAAAPASAVSAPSAGGQLVSPEIAARITAVMPNAKGAVLRTTPIPGIYEVSRGIELAYVTADGAYAMVGDLYRTAGSANLSEPRRRELRLAMLAGVGEKDSITFASATPLYTVTVFTDVDCHYCRHLHSEIDQYNRLGISVRYLFFPRTGPNTDSWFKAEQVWCSADRKSALTHAKLGEELPAKRCGDNPVARDFSLGEQLGVDGTPYIFTDTGRVFGGVVEPADLAALLKQDHAALAAAKTPPAPAAR